MIPKLTDAKMLPTQELRLEFENGEIRYLSAQLRKTILDKQHKFIGIIAGGTMSWMGNDIKINSDGSLTINNKENYTAEQIYTKSRKDYIGTIKEKKSNDK